MQQYAQDGTKLSALSELEIGKMAIVEALDLPEEVGHHLMHMGFVPDARVVVIRRAPAGDPTVYYLDGFEIALRRETARSIRVRPVEDDQR
ncbi:MAG: ferrous iron transport protein A [Silvibacterium sp.]|nr:ferrous iron transport protein A [Silvibacterium sp.]